MNCSRTRHQKSLPVPIALRTCLLASAALLGITACSQTPETTSDAQLEWARAALERNEALEVVAVDRDARVFTVRERADGALHTVGLDELVAGPAELSGRQQHAATTAEAGMPAPPTVESAPTRIGAGAESSPATPVAQASQAEAAEQPTAAAAPEPAPETVAESTTRPEYTVERSGGRVRVSGPGFSITSAESSGSELELAAARASARDEPIICEGNRMMHIDGRTLDVDGDAVIARNGCDLHITNSRIRATGVAVTAIDAKVHVTNSALDGGLRSLEIADGGKAYLRSSTLDGIVQRFGSTAELHDLGGNAWE
jgi:hypothetical protein